MSQQDYGILLQNLRDDQRHRFDRLEDKLDGKVDKAVVDKLEVEVANLKAQLLTTDNVKSVIASTLQDADARGWTAKERFMYVGAFIFLAINFLIGVLSLGPDVFGWGSGSG